MNYTSIRTRKQIVTDERAKELITELQRLNDTLLTIAQIQVFEFEVKQQKKDRKTLSIANPQVLPKSRKPNS